MLVVPLIIFTGVIYINEHSIDRNKNEKKEMAMFDVKQPPKIKQQPKPKPKPKKQPKRNQASNLKPASLGSGVGTSGLDFSLPGFQFEGGFEGFANQDDLVGDTNNSAMDSEAVDVAPRVVKRSPIVYPNLARKQGISGYVLVNLLINEEGQVEDAEIVESKPPEIFDLKALSSVRSWKFSPASYMGKTVKVWAMQRISFKLE